MSATITKDKPTEHASRHRGWKKPRRVVLIRHGESEANLDPNIYGTTPDCHIHLTRKGWNQAMWAGTHLKELHSIDPEDVRVYVSSYVRALETLEGIYKGFPALRKFPAKSDPRLVEYDTCGGNLITEDLWHVRNGIRSGNPYFYRWPNGESFADMDRRVQFFVDDEILANPGFQDEGSTPSTIVIVSHAYTNLLLMNALLERSPRVDEVAMKQSLRNGEIVVLERPDDSETGKINAPGGHSAWYKMVARANLERDGSVVKGKVGSPWWQCFPTLGRHEGFSLIHNLVRKEPPPFDDVGPSTS